MFYSGRIVDTVRIDFSTQAAVGDDPGFPETCKQDNRE
jgi:hypothetical protein